MSELHIIYTPQQWELDFVSSREKMEDITEGLSQKDLLDYINSFDYSSDEPVVISAGHLRFLIETLVESRKEKENVCVAG